ncbi:hypothetical protein AF332_03635 [Sporosarcina globispora]|uniref:HTH cro/C1-type domain-containing protein n=1 Tax=Sporosarcina globispora TaxID=1459 RepID=A0A0M0G990_SPOGL|nr:helix-turn-helix transcriptional regulator [Sporosarcina globispora]KON85991.1 hypothetical protein AF332_03635 [Sporosarcina globispora]
MLAGEIIKFYRQKAGLTQEQLGKGICTPSYVSKIELGQTECSSEIIVLIADRLNIDFDNEVSNFKILGKKLHSWHKAIIMQRMNDIEEFKKELEKLPFINSSHYGPLYHLLQARYYILKQNFEKANVILNDIQKEYPVLPPFEQNLLKHVWGIYYIANCVTNRTENHQKAVRVLNEINKEEYGNSEYYYDLALAYHCIDSKVMAYSYAEKALRYFKETNNTLMSINAESLMLLQIGNDMYLDMDELAESYQNLIYHCEILHAPVKKGMLLNNLGYEYSKRKDFANAHKYYKKVLQMTEKSSIIYLPRLFNYLESGLDGNLIPKRNLLQKAKEGKFLSRELDNRFFKILFKLLIYRIENKLDQYYSFIEKDALPYLKLNDHTSLINMYAKQLYNFYMEKEQYEKVAQVSTILIEGVS